MIDIKYLALLFFASTAVSAQLVDLTHDFDEKTIYWPTEKGFEFKREFYGMTPKKYFYSANKFCTAEHGGTHMDAPIHFSKNGLTLDEIPLENLFGPAVVIDISAKVLADKDYQISLDDIHQFEKKYRSIAAGDIVLFYTGWDKYWNNKRAYLGTDVFGDVGNLHFPGISKAVAELLVHKKVKGVGIDTASMDAGPSKLFETHQVILGANLYGLENLCHLDELPPIGAQLIIAPMKIKGGSGGPTRVIAQV